MSEVYIHGLELPEILLKGRRAIEGSVISCLLQDPLLLAESGLQEDSFVTLDGRFFYRLIQRLRAAGFETVDENSLLIVQDWQEVKDCEARNKKPFLKIVRYLSHSVNLDNWPGYLDMLIRESILCKAYKNDMLPLKEVEIEGHTFNFIERARGLSATETLELFSLCVDSFSPDAFMNSGIVEKGYIDFNDEWLESLNKGEEMGVAFARAFDDVDHDPIPVYPVLSNMMLGLKPGTLSMIAGYSSAGKSTFFVGIIMSLVSSGHKVAYISNEENRSRFQLKCLVWISYNVFHNTDLTKRILAKGEHDLEASQAIEQAREYWKENNLDDSIFYIQIPDASMDTVSKQIRTLAGQGFDVIIYDTFKMMISDMKARRSDLELVSNSRELANLAGKYNLIMLASMQLAERFKGTLWLDSSALSNSKQVKEILENLILFRNVYKSELDKASPDYLFPFNRVKNEDGTWIFKEEACSEDENWRVMFVEKSRGGANSEDTGIALLYRYDGDYSTFKEYCQCQPRHGTLGEGRKRERKPS